MSAMTATYKNKLLSQPAQEPVTVWQYDHEFRGSSFACCLTWIKYECGETTHLQIEGRSILLFKLDV